MVELVNNLQSNKGEEKSRLKRSTSYKLLERSKSVKQKRTYATNSNNQADKNSDQKVSFLPNKNFGLNDAKKDRMKSQSPKRNGFSSKKIEPSASNKNAYKEKASVNMFEIRQIKDNEGISTALTKAESPSQITVNSQANDKIAPRLRSLRFKNNMQENLEEFKGINQSLENKYAEDVPIKCKSMVNNAILLPEDNKNIKAEVYISNYNFMNGSSTYLPRRKQPRQSRKANYYSNDEKVTESDEEVDAISNEELGENSSSENPLRQTIHETKTTLQLLKINSENAKDDYYKINNLKRSYYEESQDNYEYENKYERNSNKLVNRYIPMRQVSPSHANYQIQTVDDQSNIKANYEETDRQSPVASSFTKPLALRRRNRDPYNPTNNNQDYYKTSRAKESNQYYVNVES